MLYSICQKMTRIVLPILLATLLSLSVFAQRPAFGDAPAFSDTPGIQVQAIPDTQSDRVGAKAAVVMEASTGRLLFSQAPDERLPVASTTKIMTALLTLEQPDLDVEFTVDPDAIRVEGSSMGLQEGDIVTLRALAVGMLLASGNDAAGAAAVRISGSIPSFVSAMNQRAASMQLTNTSFETPSGLDGENHYSTAADMANLAREALANPEFAAICSEYRIHTAYGNPPYNRWLTNHNKLLNLFEGTIGLKTGFTKKAGRCLVSAAERDGIRLICVTLDCPDDWRVHQSLYNRYFDSIQLEDLSLGIPPVRVPVTGGQKTEIAAVPYDSALLPVPTDSPDIQYQIKAPPFLYAPVQAGQSVGEVQIFLNGEPVRRLTLIAEDNVPLLHPYEEKISLWERLQSLFSRDG